MLTAELLKLKRNPMGLGLAVAGLALPVLVFAANQMNPSMQVKANGEAYLLPAHAVLALLTPYLLALETQQATAKWILTTPTSALKVLFEKIAVILLLVVLSLGVSFALGNLPESGAAFGAGLAGVVSSLGTLVLLSALTRNFALVLVVGFAWMQIIPRMVLALPENLQPVLAAGLPGMGITHFSGDSEHQWIRIAMTALIWALALTLWKKRGITL
ncbi:ABC transporter permease [Deinococcus roseus]|uniref:ABC transporter permease n=1 Tax=Deinococcus roseus TaxID=392414 RepID=A0ABQ2D0E9_9DEIO|nr:ABC transporter permease [Deinococcus roseus]GGJ37294.1 hypothetical protein GCM10008938_24230 [Deinococcus roseus]